MDTVKVKESLIAHGVDEETIKLILADLEEKPEEEKEPKDDETLVEGKTEKDVPPTNPDEEGKPSETPKEDEEDGNDGEGEVPPDETVPPVPEEVIPPTEVPPTEVPPTEEVPPVPPTEVPPFDPTELVNKVDEQAKTIEGLVARIESLEGALQTAGVLEKTDGEDVGISEPTLPGSSSTSADSAFASVLAKLNGNKHF